MSQFAFRRPFVTPGGAIQPILLGLAGSDATMDAPFNGTLVAPNAQVAFGVGAGLTFRGSFFALVLEIRPQSTLVCDAGVTPPLP